MKRILTAIGNEKINNELNKIENFKVISNDIQYKEGIIEILEDIQDIDFIILNSLLPGEINLIELIKQINLLNEKVKLIIFIEKNNPEIDKLLSDKKIYRILYNNEIEIEDLVDIIKDSEIINNEELKEEINKLKNIILEKENNNKFNKRISKLFKINNIKKIFNIKIKEKFLPQNANNKEKNNNTILTRGDIKFEKENIKNKKVISITGPPSVGKSIFSINFAKINSYENSENKILIIDADIINSSIHIILGLQKNSIKINKKIDFITLNINNVNSFTEIIEKNEKKYDLIIIDTSSCNELLELNKQIIEISSLNLFISDTNLLEINKSIKLLEKYINKLKINKNRFQIIFNKYNKESIDFNLLKNIFSEFNIIGCLKYSEQYNNFINKNNTSNLINNKIKNEYYKINKLILNNKSNFNK